MSTNITFTTSDFDGLTAEIYDASFSPFMMGPDATTTINNGRASFNINPPNPFAVRVTDGRAFLRTGFLTQAVGDVDANGDFGASFLVMHLTDPADTTITLATLAAGISVPITEGALTVTSLALATAVSGGVRNLRATGAGTYAAGFLGNIPVAYTYNFRLSPIGSALSSRVIDVDTVSTTVTGASGGLLGWIVNAIVSLIGILFNGTISDQIEASVQAQVNTAVDNAFASAGAPSEAFATVRTVTVNPANVVIDPWVSIPLSALDCASLISSGSVKVRDPKQVRKLRAMRDKALRGTPQGEVYVDLLRQHSPELLRILAANPRLLKGVDEVVKRGLAEYDEEAPGKGQLTGETAKMGLALMGDVAELSSPELRQTLEMAMKDVDQFVKQPVSKVLDDNTEAARKLARK